MANKLNPIELDMFLNFIVRHRRFLKGRETSFSPAQLEDGKKKVEKAVKAVEKKKFTPEELEEAITKKAAALARDVKSAANLTPKQAQLIVVNYRSFEAATRQPQTPKVVLEPAKNDLYYAPKPHKYR